MCDTAFILLVSDYIVADGGLRTVFDRIAGGASGVLAGNFQIVAEEAIPILRKHFAQSRAEISLNPRQLLKWTLAYLHPATSANIVNLPVSHNVHTNRLFWRVDNNTLIGRFYLMHMIGIRPEVTDFVVGASCDYSFIPEMCPSDNVVILDDSDDYLVVEMQPRDHEAKHLQWGPLEPAELATSLAEWTTERHRKNVFQPITYHSDEIPADTARIKEESDRYIDEVSRHLTTPAQPYRNHPYWLGAIAAHRFDTAQSVSDEDYKALIGGDIGTRSGGLVGFLWHARRMLFGTYPDVTAWHPRWPDFHLLLERFSKLAKTSPVLIVSDSAGVYGRWLAGMSRDSQSVDIGRMLNLSRAQYMPLVNRFKGALLVLPEGELKRADRLLARIGPILAPNSVIFAIATNDRLADPAGFAASFAYHSGRFTNLGIWIKSIGYTRSSRLRWLLRDAIVRIARWTTQKPRIVFVAVAPVIALLTIALYLCNRTESKLLTSPPRRALCSSVLLELETSSELPLPDFSVDPSDRESQAPVSEVRSPGLFDDLPV